jgi:hypothetical protein
VNKRGFKLRLFPACVGAMACVAFGYVLMGVKWPVGSNVGYYVNANSTKVTGELAAVQSAAGTWSSVNPAGFRLTYQGSTAVTSYGRNSLNTICWENQGASSTLATTYTWFWGSTILENDIVFNDAQSWSTTGNDYDVETVALHEMGHVVGLDHSSTGIMTPYYEGIRRSLDSDARAGFIALYGGSGGGGGAKTDFPPSISITSPAPGANVSGAVTFAATASDDVGIDRVEFFVNSALAAKDPSPPYQFAWDTSSILNASYTLKAVAYDTIGQTAQAQITVFVIPHAPRNFSGVKKNNSSTLLEQYINVLTWEAHDKNQNIQGYRLYLQSGANGSLLQEFDAQTFSFLHKNIDKNNTYSYVLKAFDGSNREGDAAVLDVK